MFNNQRRPIERKTIMVQKKYSYLGWLVASLALIGCSNDHPVIAFTPNTLVRSHFTSISGNAASASSFGLVRVDYNEQCNGRSSRLNINPLGMASNSGEGTKKSKRKRLKESVKKIVVYPKNKIKRGFKKIRSSRVDEHATEEHFKVNTASGLKVSGHHNGVNGDAAYSIRRKEVPLEGMDEVNGDGQHTASSKTVQATLEKKPAVVNGDQATSRSSTTQSVDLSGKWELVVSDEFKTNYDRYLKLLGQPSLVRSVALSIIGMTAEETFQSDMGRELKIRGRNVRGNWERTLQASSGEDPLVVPIVTADNETVQSECWWEENGTIHHSWLRGVEKYGGGNFESKRYLEDGGQTLVCESCFHPTLSGREKACVVWKFKRVEEAA